MLKMMRKSVRGFSSCYSHCSSSSSRGMPFLHPTPPLVALFHSRSSKPTKCRETQLGNRPSKSNVSNVENALMVFDEMLHSRPLPSVVRFNQLLGQLAKLKHYSAVLSLNRQMGLIGIASDAYTLTIIINCYCHLNHMGFSLSVLAQFFKLGLQPDVPTFNTLIHGFVLHNRVADAARLFSKMGRHCQPVDALCKEGMVLEAKTVVDMMIQRHIEPDVVTYSSLMDGYCSRGEMDEAKQVFDLMVSKGSMVNVQCCTILINGYCKGKNIDKAYKIFKEMHRMKLVLDTVTYTTLIGGFCKMGRIQEAEKLFSQMQRCGQHPSIQTYTVLLDALCSNQQLSKATELLREMKDKKLELDIVIYSIIIEGLCKAGKMDSAIEVFSGLSFMDFVKGAY